MLQTPATTKEEEVIEEEIIVGDDDNVSHKFQAEFFPTIVRSEMNFLRLPFFSLQCRDSKKKEELVYEFTEVRDGKKFTLTWSVIPSVRYGRPTAFDRRVVRGFDVIVDEEYVRNGFQLVNPVPFSIYRIAELMGYITNKKRSRKRSSSGWLYGSSGWLYDDIKTSFKRMVATTVESKGSFYLKDTEVWVDKVFHPYEDVVFVGMKGGEGSVSETNYLKLHEFYLSNINARYVRPLDYDFLVRLKNDIASRMYEVLSPKFYGLDRRLSYYQVDYQDFCKTLPITPQRYYSDAKRQLRKAHEELGSWEYISKVAYVLHRGSKKVKTLRFYLGERAKRERDGEFLRRAKFLHVEEQLLLPLAGKETETIELSGLAKELHERGIKPKRVAAELCQNYDEDYIREKIGIFDFHLKADDGTISDNPAGWLRTAVETDITPTKKQIKVSKAAVRQQVDEQVRELELEEEKIKKPYEDKCEKIFEKIITANEELVKETIQEALVEKPMLNQWYDESKPFTDQSMMIQATIRPKLREKFPDMFKAVDDEYQSQVDKIDKQIDELQNEST